MKAQRHGGCDESPWRTREGLAFWPLLGEACGVMSMACSLRAVIFPPPTGEAAPGGWNRMLRLTLPAFYSNSR